MNQIGLAFITGLTTGGLSCLAVQGGLVASAVSARATDFSTPAQNGRIIGFFLSAKLLAHMLLGFLLGTVGSFLVLSPATLGLLQIGVGIYLVLTALRIANVHPVFRYFVFQPPRIIYRLMRTESKNNTWIAPGFLGILSVLMPCGVTQAMMAVAIASGSGAGGALIMGAFVLGTSPLFFMLGATITGLFTRPLFAYGAALVIAIFGGLSINGGLGLRGSIYTFQNFYKVAIGDSENPGLVAGISDGKQYATLYVKSDGYSTQVRTLKAGIPVTLSLVTNQTQGCSRAFTIPKYGISKILPASGTERLEFTPKEPGRLAYACSMGMYTGEFDVIP